jgi:hypothetical protein
LKNDAIFPLTRAIAGVVVLFLVAAFVILFFLPDQTGTLFAWAIKPHMSSMFFGSAYLGGAWILAQTAIGKRWHRVQAVFPAVTLFTIAMLVATLLHWDRFSLGTAPFIAWLILYIVSPFLIPALWIYNRCTASHEPEESDVVVPTTARLVFRLFGGFVLLLVTICYLLPSLIIPIWPWELTPLTARVLCGWLSVIGTLSFVISFDPRWTGWRASLQGICIAYIFIFVAAFMNPADFKTSTINWFNLFMAVMLVAILVFYNIMESRRRQK